MGNTLIQISDELYEKLNALKNAENKTYEKVIHELIKSGGKKDGDTQLDMES